jgi:thymidylate kinase
MTQFLTELFALLNAQYQYAVLRNFAGLPAVNDSRDIDILIPRHELNQLKKSLPRLCKECDCKIMYTNADNQFLTVVLADSDYQVFQLDFQHNFAWMGIDLLDERAVLSRRIFNGKVYHLPPDLTFLPKYIYCRILGSPYPGKYAEIRQEALEFDQIGIEQTLMRLTPGGGLQYWDNSNKWSLRFRAFLSILRQRPLRAIGRMAEFLFRYGMDLFCRRGLMISFSGPDGCGKTTVLELLCGRLGVNPPILFHFRPALLPNLGEVGAKAGLLAEVDRNFDQPHRAKPKGKLNSLIRLAYYSADYILGYVVKILPIRQRKHIVVFDRYFTDIIVDGERSSIFLNYKFLTFLRRFIPRCQYNFLFKVDPETILSRKRELTKHDIERIYTRLEYLAKRDRRYFYIDNNGTPEQAVKQIIDILLLKNNFLK